MTLTYKVKVPSSTVLDSPAKVQAAVTDFLSNGTGPLSSTGGEIFGKSLEMKFESRTQVLTVVP